MAMTDDIGGKMGDMSEETQQRIAELQSQEEDGNLSEAGRQELEQLRGNIGME